MHRQSLEMFAGSLIIIAIGLVIYLSSWLCNATTRGLGGSCSYNLSPLNIAILLIGLLAFAAGVWMGLRGKRS